MSKQDIPAINEYGYTFRSEWEAETWREYVNAWFGVEPQAVLNVEQVESILTQEVLATRH